VGAPPLLPGVGRAAPKDYEVLTNVVDLRNSVHVRWLGWFGFKFLKDHVINAHTFIQFERRAPCATQLP
jgi:hypothetical protein